MCQFPVVAVPEGVFQSTIAGARGHGGRGRCAPSSGGVVSQVRVWSDAEMGGGGHCGMRRGRLPDL